MITRGIGKKLKQMMPQLRYNSTVMPVLLRRELTTFCSLVALLWLWTLDRALLDLTSSMRPLALSCLCALGDSLEDAQDFAWVFPLSLVLSTDRTLSLTPLSCHWLEVLLLDDITTQHPILNCNVAHAFPLPISLSYCRFPLLWTTIPFTYFISGFWFVLLPSSK